MIEPGRMTATYQGDVVVFFIGMRINRWWLVHKWVPVVRAMFRMIDELAADRDSGFLGATAAFPSLRMPSILQYWRSFDHLDAYAHDPAREHQPAWRAFNKAVGGDGTVGIFHETYVVPAGASETLYANMPRFGLGTVEGTTRALGSRRDARARLGQASRPTEDGVDYR